MLYNAIVASKSRKYFETVNKKNFDSLLKDCHPKINHRFGGDHALGGERHTAELFYQWCQRLGRLQPGLYLTVRDVWVKGWPWNTVVIVRWDASDTLPDGSEYWNHGVHVIRMKWFKVVEIDANEDSQAVERNLRMRKEQGVEEAGMPPIEA